MGSTTIAVEKGPRTLLTYLLMHQRASAGTLATTLNRSATQIDCALHRLARRGIVAERAGAFEIAADRRTFVADYTEGAISLRALVQTA